MQRRLEPAVPTFVRGGTASLARDRNLRTPESHAAHVVPDAKALRAQTQLAEAGCRRPLAAECQAAASW